MNQEIFNNMLAIATRVKAEQANGGTVAPHRMQWANDMLLYANTKDDGARRRLMIEEPSAGRGAA